jgi:hypothetical protein
MGRLGLVELVRHGAFRSGVGPPANPGRLILGMLKPTNLEPNRF